MHEFISTFSVGSDAADAPTMAIKDTIDIAGFPTTAASRALADAPPATRHADVVERVLAAGWRVVGKTNMHELAFGMTGINAYTGTPANPQDPMLIPGGSSSGSAAAVGLGLADAALGTDTGGSIRGPAACCAVIGFKPTFGRVSRRGVAPTHSTLDCVGPFARSMRVLVDAMTAIAPDFEALPERVPASVGTVGLVTTHALPAIADAVARAPSRAGFGSRTLRFEGLAAAFEAGLTIINAETWSAFGHLLETGCVGEDLRARLVAASKTTTEALEAAQAVRHAFTLEVDRALESVDVLILPTLPDFPVTLQAALSGTSVIAMSSLIRPFNLSGHPALSLPIAIGGSPLKAGLQIVGRKGADEAVCAIAAHFEAALRHDPGVVPSTPSGAVHVGQSGTRYGCSAGPRRSHCSAVPRAGLSRGDRRHRP